MAKIYENHLDVERDRLKDQATAAHAAADHSWTGTFYGAMTSFAAYFIEKYESLSAKVHNEQRSGFGKGLNTALMWMGGISAAMSLANWFSRSQEANRADAQVKAMGPEEVKYPGLDVGEHKEEVAKGTHCDRLKEVATAGTRQL